LSNKSEESTAIFINEKINYYNFSYCTLFITHGYCDILTLHMSQFDSKLMCLISLLWWELFIKQIVTILVFKTIFLFEFQASNNQNLLQRKIFYAQSQRQKCKFIFYFYFYFLLLFSKFSVRELMKNFINLFMRVWPTKTKYIIIFLKGGTCFKFLLIDLISVICRVEFKFPIIGRYLNWFEIFPENNYISVHGTFDGEWN
jgi:hypothetical protein